MLFADGYDDAIIGIALNPTRLVYDANAILRTLQERDGMDELDAAEFFEFNIADAYAGPRTPVFAYPREERP